MIMATIHRRDIGEGGKPIPREGHTKQSICRYAQENRYRIVIKPSYGNFYYLKGQDMTKEEAAILLILHPSKIKKSDNFRAWVLDW